MSTIRADNYSKRDGSLTISADTLLQGTAKVWQNMNGSGTIALRDSFNVSSILDLGQGTYRTTFSSARPNSNFSPVASTMPAAAQFLVSDQITFTQNNTTTTIEYATGFYSTAGAQTLRDADGVYISIHGDP